jgi:hypothetical protein
MIQAFVDKFMACKPILRNRFRHKPPEDYKDLVVRVVSLFHDVDKYHTPDAKRVHEICDGSYQGTLVYVIAEQGYSPDIYWYVQVSYGSCSSCDTLEHIKSRINETPSEECLDEFMTLALHIVQGLRQMSDK